MKLADTFDAIYRDGVWGKDEEGLGYSGPGSTAYATRMYRAFLEGFLSTGAVRSVVDAGCGDWTFSRDVAWPPIQYRGYDASAVAIAKASRYAGMARSFEVADITQPLPSADLLLCKDVLQHLPNAMVQAFIENNLKPGKYKYAIITNDKGEGNPDIVVGGHRALDLSAPPFNVTGLLDLGISFQVFGNKVSQLLYL